MSRRPLRVLDLRDSPWVDGPGRTILQSASMVDNNRCEIIVGAFYGDSHGEHEYMREAEDRNLQILAIKETKAFDRKVVRQILDAIETLSIDILHTHDFRSDLYGLVCAKKAGIPVISTCHGWIANNLKGKIYTLIDKFLLRLFNRVITVSATMKNQLSRSGIKERNIRVVINALIIENYSPDRSDKRFRDELGLSSETLLIANIGRLSPEKGQDIMLRAAREILKSHSDICFIFIGIGPQQAYLEELASDLGISEHVVFSGYRKDMHSIYNSLDLVVQSSYTEGMPNVVLESLLMQVPVVATDVGGTGEVMQNGFSGILIEAGSLKDLVDGINWAIQNPEQMSNMAANGREFVSKNFDHNQRVEKLTKVYEEFSVDGMKGH